MDTGSRQELKVIPQILSITLDDEVALEVFMELKEKMDRHASNARVGWDGGVQIQKEKEGSVLDIYRGL